MNYEIKKGRHYQYSYQYIEEGDGDVLLLLHGLFGALSNFEGVIEHFSKEYKVVVPILPIYKLPLYDASLTGLVKYVSRFVKYKKYDKVKLVGNSLGGHIALMYILKYPKRVDALVLTGSSGLFEDTMGGSFPKRGSYEYVKERTEYTFYDPKSATKELIDEVFEAVNNRPKVLRIIYMARSAMRNNLSKELHKINCPTFLIWGANDNITPPYVAKEFKRLIPNADLAFIDKCGHAPMMEDPSEFNVVLDKWLKEKFNVN